MLCHFHSTYHQTLLSAVLLILAWVTQRERKLLLHGSLVFADRTSLILLTHQLYMRNACCSPEFSVLLAMCCSAHHNPASLWIFGYIIQAVTDFFWTCGHMKPCLPARKFPPALGDLNQQAATHLKHPSYLTSCVELQHSKQLLWGWYTLRYYPPDALLEAIAKRLTPLVHNMDAFTLSEFIWAFGGLNYEPGNMQLFLQVCLSHALYTLWHYSSVVAGWLFMFQEILTCLASGSCMCSSSRSCNHICLPYATAQTPSMLCVEVAVAF